MMYAAQLGTNPLLSIAEIMHRMPASDSSFHLFHADRHVAIFSVDDALEDAQALLNTMGGTIRLIALHEASFDGERTADIDLESFFAEQDVQAFLGLRDHGKHVFAIGSFDRFASPRDVNTIGIRLKKMLRARGTSARYVNVRGNVMLGAASIWANNILRKGFELMLIPADGRVYIGKTVAIQAIDAYTLRDAHRPVRDMKVGMIPPKLAQVMLSLAGFGKSSTILDPFCGLGTIINEALAQGIVCYGSDHDERMVEASRKNASWLQSLAATPNRLSVPASVRDVIASYDASQMIVRADAREVSPFASSSFDAVVTESYLGPLVTSPPSGRQLQEIRSTIEQLVRESFAQMVSLLREHGRIVITFPYYVSATGPQFVISSSCIDNLERLGYHRRDLLSEELYRIAPKMAQPERKSLLYARPDQVVGREIMVFEKS
jgi:tRNA G10  N-methylase Trm11